MQGPLLARVAVLHAALCRSIVVQQLVFWVLAAQVGQSCQMDPIGQWLDILRYCIGVGGFVDIHISGKGPGCDAPTVTDVSSDD